VALSCVVLLIACRFETSEATTQAYPELDKQAAGVSKTHEEAAAISSGGDQPFASVSALSLTPAGNLLICDPQRKNVHTVSPEGKPLGRWDLGWPVQAVDVAADGTVFAGGAGRVAKISSTGQVLKLVRASSGGFPDSDVTGIAITGKDLFVAFRDRPRFGIYRFNHELAETKKVASRLSGCCGTMDIAAHGDGLYVAENGRHRVVKYDREGKVLAQWGERAREGMEGFGGCCNPMNICTDGKGFVYTAESYPDRVKRYSPDGKFLGVVGWFAGGKSCSCEAIAANEDGTRVYVADYRQKNVRVLVAKPASDDVAKSDEP